MKKNIFEKFLCEVYGEFWTHFLSKKKDSHNLFLQAQLSLKSLGSIDID